MRKIKKYRPEIDGLRALSVLLVILHHLEVPGFSGGYIGVDVFFVISGYLITSIVYGEILDGSFSFKKFYKRRIVRLAPAYFLVVFATTVFCFFALLPSEFNNYAESVIYSTFFMANFYMWSEAGGYFGVQADFIPLLHLWSLAVEEQFYIFWPFILLCFHKMFSFRWIALFFFIATIISLLVSEWGAQQYLAAAYYLMPTRAVELMLGASLILAPKLQLQNIVRNGLTLSGLALIFFSVIFYTTETSFPGINVLVPCFGAMLLICFSDQYDIVGKTLSMASVVKMGKVSYPAYLWHWPIIVALNIYIVEISFWSGLGVVVGTFVLSFLTHHYFETPAKIILSYDFRKASFLGFIIPASFLLLLALLIMNFDGLPNRFSQSLALKNKAIMSLPGLERGRCNEGNVLNPLSADDCILGVNRDSVDFLLVGDSHANHFTGMLDEMAKDARLRGYDITQSQTIYFPDAKFFYLKDGKMVESVNFIKRNQVLTKIIQNGKFEKVILAGTFPYSINNGDYRLDAKVIDKEVTVFKKQFIKSIEIILKSGSTPYIINDNPAFKKNIHKCEILNERFGLTENCTLSRSDYLEQFAPWSEFVDELLSLFPELRFIDPNKVFCDEQFCKSELNGVPLYRDSGHLNQMGSRLIGKEFIKIYGNPLIN